MKINKSLVFLGAVVSLWAFNTPNIYAGHHGHSPEKHSPATHSQEPHSHANKPHGKHEHKALHGMGSRTVEEYIRMFEDPEREKWQMPWKVVNSLGLKPGDAVADIGAGSGYFSVIFAKKVGENGKVYAVDVEPGMVSFIQERAEKEGFKNITPILAQPNNPLLSPGSFDVVFICDTLHHIGNRPDYLGLVGKALKTGGRLAIVDFKKEETAEGPPIGMRLSRDDVVNEITASGYVLQKEFDALPYQYFLVFGLKE